MNVLSWFAIALVGRRHLPRGADPTPEAAVGRCRQKRRCRHRQISAGQEGRRECTPPPIAPRRSHWAVEANNLEIANLLLGAGANVNGPTRYKITPLALACRERQRRDD